MFPPFSGEKAFKLHDTYGFPIDITEEIFMESGYEIDKEGFIARMEEQKKMGRTDAAESDVAWEDPALGEVFKEETEFTGYDRTEGKGKFWLYMEKRVRRKTSFWIEPLLCSQWRSVR